MNHVANPVAPSVRTHHPARGYRGAKALVCLQPLQSSTLPRGGGEGTQKCRVRKLSNKDGSHTERLEYAGILSRPATARCFKGRRGTSKCGCFVQEERGHPPHNLRSRLEYFSWCAR